MTNFERTLGVLQDVLNDRLLSDYKKIWVQGNNKPNSTTILFTIFAKNEYFIKTISIKNFRQFRQDGNIDDEMVFIDSHINSFSSILSKYITYANN